VEFGWILRSRCAGAAGKKVREKGKILFDVELAYLTIFRRLATLRILRLGGDVREKEPYRIILHRLTALVRRGAHEVVHPQPEDLEAL
jgi:hypothetical protein